MEENVQPEESGKLVLPPKSSSGSKSKKKSTTTDKDKEAKAKVQELLKNTPVAALVGATNDSQVVKPETISQERSQKWLEDQVDILSKQVEELENEIVWYKSEMGKMQQNATQLIPGGQGLQPNPELESNLVELFRHFENLHLRYNRDGNFMVKISYPATRNGILDKFLEYFPFLQKYQRFQNPNM